MQKLVFNVCFSLNFLLLLHVFDVCQGKQPDVCLGSLPFWVAASGASLPDTEPYNTSEYVYAGLF